MFGQQLMHWSKLVKKEERYIEALAEMDQQISGLLVELWGEWTDMSERLLTSNWFVADGTWACALDRRCGTGKDGDSLEQKLGTFGHFYTENASNSRCERLPAAGVLLVLAAIWQPLVAKKLYWNNNKKSRWPMAAEGERREG
jgi:hypothetical protein